MRIFPITSTSDSSTVTASAAQLGGALAANLTYQFVSSTNCWIRQGTSYLVTVVTNANMTDGDYITINLGPKFFYTLGASA